MQEDGFLVCTINLVYIHPRVYTCMYRERKRECTRIIAQAHCILNIRSWPRARARVREAVCKRARVICIYMPVAGVARGVFCYAKTRDARERGRMHMQQAT